MAPAAPDPFPLLFHTLFPSFFRFFLILFQLFFCLFQNLFPIPFGPFSRLSPARFPAFSAPCPCRRRRLCVHNFDTIFLKNCAMV